MLISILKSAKTFILTIPIFVKSSNMALVYYVFLMSYVIIVHGTQGTHET